MQMIKVHLLAAILIWIAGAASLRGNGLDSVVPYLQTIGKYRCIEYKHKSYQSPESGIDADMWNGLMLIESYETKHELNEEYYWVRREVYIQGKSKATWHFVSLVGDEERQYVDPDCPLYRHDRTGWGGGVIQRTDRLEESEYLGIDAYLGCPNLTHCLGLRKRLTELLQTRPLREGPRGEVVIEDIYNMPKPYASYDLEIIFDPEHDYLPKEIRAYQVIEKLGQRNLRNLWQVNQFYRDPQSGLTVPVDMEASVDGKFARRLIVDKNSIFLNKTIPKDAYRIEFPPTIEYLDNIRREMVLNGKVIEKLDPLPTIDSKWGVSRMVSVAVVCILFLGALFFLFKRRSAYLLLFCLASIGCSPISRDKIVSNEAALNSPIIVAGNDGSPLLELLDGSSKSVRIQVGEDAKTSVDFRIRNRSQSELVLSSFVSTSCGCAQVSMSPLDLKPGGDAVLHALIDSFPTTGKKSISLRATVDSPVKLTLNFSIDATVYGDWVVSDRSIVLTGKVGRSSEEIVRVKGYRDVITQLEVSASNGISVKEIQQRNEDERAFAVSGTIKTSSSEALLGTLYIVSPIGLPRLEEVSISERGIASANWSEPMIQLSEGQASRLTLSFDADNEFVSLETTSGIEAKTLEATDGQLTFEITMNKEAINGLKVGEVSANVRYREATFRVPCRVILSGM
ncbi:MAG: DUF1573 domain-containing protein [Pirellula sp.]|nr:DUF1573 domain-containing protein [Pirellula sp.]